MPAPFVLSGPVSLFPDPSPSPPMSPLRLVPILAAALALAACGHPSSSSEAPAPAKAATTLALQNTRAEPFDIYVSDGTRRLYLGQARPLTTTRMRIPSTIVFPATTLQFIAVPLSGVGASITEQVTVSPGQTVHVMLAR